MAKDLLESLVGGLPAAGLGVAGSIASSVISNNLAKQQEARAMNYWKMQQEYNSPKNQVARLEQAGINPALAYSQGQIGNVATTPAQAMVGAAPDFSRVSQDILQGQLIESQINKNNADADSARSNAGLASAKTITENLMRDINAEFTQQQTKELEQKVQNMITEKSYIEGQTKVMEAQEFAQKLENEFNEKSFNDRLEAIMLQNGVAKADIAVKAAEVKATLAGIQIGFMNAKANLTSAAASMKNAQINERIMPSVIGKNLSEKQRNEAQTYLTNAQKWGQDLYNYTYKQEHTVRNRVLKGFNEGKHAGAMADFLQIGRYTLEQMTQGIVGPAAAALK